MAETTNGHRPASRMLRTARLVVFAGVRLEDAMISFRRAVVLEALFKCSGNLCRAARLLGVHRNTMNRDFKELPADVQHAVAYLRRKTEPEARAAAAHFLRGLRR